MASCSPATTRTTTSAPAGLNFTALWSRFRSAWPRRSPSPRTSGTGPPASTTRRTPCRSAKRLRRSTVALARCARSTSWRTSAAPPLLICERSSSSLTIWTRWPVSTSILAIRSAVRRGSWSASSASVSARRLTVVSGVRSSGAILSMYSVWRRCSRRSSETSSRTSHAPPSVVRRARTRSVGASAVRIASSPPAVPVRRAVWTISSSRWSVNASITLRPGSPDARRASSRAPGSFALTTVRSLATRTTPIPARSTRTSTSRDAAAARSSAAAARPSARSRSAAGEAGAGAARDDPRRCSPTARTSAATPSAPTAARARGSTAALAAGSAAEARLHVRKRLDRALAGRPDGHLDAARGERARADRHDEGHPQELGVGELHARRLVAVVPPDLAPGGEGQVVEPPGHLRDVRVLRGAQRHQVRGIRGHLRRPGDPLRVVMRLDDAGEGASDADPVAAHHDRVAAPVLAQVLGAQRGRVLRAELEDVADLDPVPQDHGGAACRAAVALAGAREVRDEVRRVVARDIHVSQVEPMPVRPGDEVRRPGNQGIDHHERVASADRRRVAGHHPGSLDLLRPGGPEDVEPGGVLPGNRLYYPPP